MSASRLFSNLPISVLRQQCRESAQNAAAGVPEDELAATSIEQIVEQIVADKVPRQIELNTADHEVSKEEGTSPRQFGGMAMSTAVGGQAHAVQLSLHIPFTGNSQLFIVQPSNFTTLPPQAMLIEDEVTLSVVGTFDAGQARQELLGQEQILLQWVEWVNADVRSIETQVRSEVSNRLQQRRSLARSAIDLLAKLDLPIRHVGSDRALELPIQPARAVVAPTASPSSGQPEYRLSEGVYEQILKTITGFGHALERRPESASHLLPDEETLRDWLIFLLNTNYEDASGGEVFIGGETVNGKGKTDILVRHQNRNAFIGECKFWRGVVAFDEAIEQLLGYTVWRDSKAAIILFITNKNATAAIDQAGAHLREHVSCQMATTPSDPYCRQDFKFVSPHDDQRTISLALLPVVVAPPN